MLIRMSRRPSAAAAPIHERRAVASPPRQDLRAGRPPAGRRARTACVGGGFGLVLGSLDTDNATSIPRRASVSATTAPMRLPPVIRRRGSSASSFRMKKSWRGELPTRADVAIVGAMATQDASAPAITGSPPTIQGPLPSGSRQQADTAECTSRPGHGGQPTPKMTPHAVRDKDEAHYQSQHGRS